MGGQCDRFGNNKIKSESHIEEVKMTNRKGLIHAGGSGNQLYPFTKAVGKPLMPVYDKPMVYYPISTLMLAGIRDVLLISTPQDAQQFTELLGDGGQWGMNIQYAVQASSDGPAQAFILGKDFVGNNPSTLVLGDNILYGNSLQSLLKRASDKSYGASIFAFNVQDPERYGVVNFNNDHCALLIEEKPLKTKSNYAVTGLYFYDNQVCEIVSNICPSSRGELKITDVNAQYLKQNQLTVEIMGRGYAWLDTGSNDSLLDTAHFISIIEKRQGLKIACPEEIAFRAGWIDGEQLFRLANPMLKSGYGQYLMKVLAEKI